jgi:hypothetical protein
MFVDGLVVRVANERAIRLQLSGLARR